MTKYRFNPMCPYCGQRTQEELEPTIHLVDCVKCKQRFIMRVRLYPDYEVIPLDEGHR